MAGPLAAVALEVVAAGFAVVTCAHHAFGVRALACRHGLLGLAGLAGPLAAVLFVMVAATRRGVPCAHHAVGVRALARRRRERSRRIGDDHRSAVHAAHGYDAVDLRARGGARGQHDPVAEWLSPAKARSVSLAHRRKRSGAIKADGAGDVARSRGRSAARRCSMSDGGSTQPVSATLGS